MSEDLPQGVTALPVKHKEPPAEGRFLVPVEPRACRHYRGPFEVNADAGKCFCKQCGGEVSPMFVLERLMLEESKWNQTRQAYQAEMARLSERSRTKCQHCHQMTRISGN